MGDGATLKNWLRCLKRSPSPYTSFELTDIDEIEQITEEVRSHIVSLIELEKFDPGFVSSATEILGWKKLQASLEGKTPKTIRMRRGQFGEVLAPAVLEQFHGYRIPVRKLRFAISSDQSLPGTDTIAIRIDGSQISEVSFVESKLRTRNDTSAAVKGYEQLKSDQEALFPDMLRFVAEILWMRKDPLYGPFMQYLRTRAEKQSDTLTLFLTWEYAVWSERVLQNLQEHRITLKPLTVHAARIRDLQQLVENIFGRIGVTELVDDEDE